MDREQQSEEPTLAALTSFALELGQRARKETLTRFRQSSTVDDKSAGGAFDPVTDADRAAEQSMRQTIAERFPTHGISGEEWPDHVGSSGFLWSLDPIDGTRSFICGLPTWTTLIALIDDGAPILGLVDVPCLDETYVGTRGEAWVIHQGQRSPLRTSGCTRLDEARLSTTDPDMFGGSAADAFQLLRSATRTVRYGHDAYAYARLAAGTIDLVVESGLKPYDYNALVPLVRGAGGTIADWQGTQEYGGGNIIAAATAELFEQARAYFAAA